MFENLTQREKLLAAAVGCMMPVIVLFMAWYSFNTKYQSQRSALVNLDTQITDEIKKQSDVQNANLRRQYYYRSSSFPTGPGNVTRYQDWMLRLIADCGLRYQSLAKPGLSKLTVRSQTGQGVLDIGEKLTFMFDATGTLDQIMKFIYEFEQLDLLHKIKELTLTPEVNKKALTGKCKAAFRVEVLSLVDADESRDFLNQRRIADKSLEEYEQVVVSRNMFGPANNAPSLSVSRQKFTEGDEVSVNLSGRDEDKNDQLSYEILDNGGIEDATIDQKEGSNRARLVSSALPIGEYTLKVRVQDNGFPAKFSDEEFMLAVEKVKEIPVSRELPPAPPYKNIAETQINRISSRNGVFEVKIRVRPTGEVFELKQGDQFTLDDETWTVAEIGISKLTLETRGKTLEFRQGDFLDKPRKETEVPDSVKPDVSEVSSTDE